MPASSRSPAEVAPGAVMGKKLVIVLVPMTAVPGVAVPAVGVSPDVHAANVNSMANTR
jgi:hypothetical protein